MRVYAGSLSTGHRLTVTRPAPAQIRAYKTPACALWLVDLGGNNGEPEAAEAQPAPRRSLGRGGSQTSQRICTEIAAGGKKDRRGLRLLYKRSRGLTLGCSFCP